MGDEHDFFIEATASGRRQAVGSSGDVFADEGKITARQLEEIRAPAGTGRLSAPFVGVGSETT